MNTIREIEKINKEELDRGIAGTAASWHTKYSKSAWVYIGNLDHELTEGDIICVMSQYGEVRSHFVLSFYSNKRDPHSIYLRLNVGSGKRSKTSI